MLPGISHQGLKVMPVIVALNTGVGDPGLPTITGHVPARTPPRHRLTSKAAALTSTYFSPRSSGIHRQRSMLRASVVRFAAFVSAASAARSSA